MKENPLYFYRSEVFFLFFHIHNSHGIPGIFMFLKKRLTVIVVKRVDLKIYDIAFWMKYIVENTFHTQFGF